MVDSGDVRARLFVALWPPDVVVKQVEQSLAPLRRTCDELRWQPPERWHITLAFLGDRDMDKTLERFDRVSGGGAQPIRIAGSGRFGPVLWLGVEETGWLAQLAAEVQQSMRVEQRRFRGHVTIARSRTKSGEAQGRVAARELAHFGSSRWRPEEFSLVRSTVGPRPAYEVIARSPLGCVSG